jgi:pilus assembly protein Flp/PilA
MLKLIVLLQNFLAMPIRKDDFLAMPIRKDDRGATAVEYGLMVGLIAAVIITVVVTLGGQIHDAFLKVSTSI